MKVHKLFILLSSKEIRNNLNIYFNRKKIDLNNEDHRYAIKQAWQTLFLIVPVASTTFASAGKLSDIFEDGEIDYLFIDEAGQAVPQAAAGAIWRSNHVTAVGDPLQIEPVITMPETLLNDIRAYYNVNPDYLSMNASVQSLGDLANAKGHWKTSDHWIGIPLWVHRRCKDPMFSIANKNKAYDNKMVLVKEAKSSLSYWIDVAGKATKNQYVPQQGEALATELLRSSRSGSTSLKDIYVITPFAAIKDELKSLLRKKLKPMNVLSEKDLKDWINKNIGTVHTFQGKEAETVYFVVGTDEDQPGSANWIIQKPNLINVAVTRAKDNFIIIGDQKRLSKLPIFSDVDKLVNIKIPENSSMK